MRKALILIGFIYGLAACSSEPMTPEQARALQQAGDAMGDTAQLLNNMNRPQPMQSTTQTQQCHLIDLGGGNYQRTCSNY